MQHSNMYVGLSTAHVCVVFGRGMLLQEKILPRFCCTHGLVPQHPQIETCSSCHSRSLSTYQQIHRLLWQWAQPWQASVWMVVDQQKPRLCCRPPQVFSIQPRGFQVGRGAQAHSSSSGVTGDGQPSLSPRLYDIQPPGWVGALANNGGRIMMPDWGAKGGLPGFCQKGHDG